MWNAYPSHHHEGGNIRWNLATSWTVPTHATRCAAIYVGDIAWRNDEIRARFGHVTHGIIGDMRTGCYWSILIALIATWAGIEGGLADEDAIQLTIGPCDVRTWLPRMRFKYE